MKKGLRCLLRWLIIWGLMLAVLFLTSCFMYRERLLQVLIAYGKAFLELLVTIVWFISTLVLLTYYLFIRRPRR